MAAPRVAKRSSSGPDATDPQPATRPGAADAVAGLVTTDIPARLDRLRWSPFHSLVVTALGVAATIVLLDPAFFSPDIGWRLCCFIGAALGLVVFIMRFWIPESPRWLVIHGDAMHAAAIVDDIERRARQPLSSDERG